MTRAHLLARRFRDVMPSYQASLSYALKVVWADHKARAEHRQRFAGFVFRPLTARQIADSRHATREPRLMRGRTLRRIYWGRNQRP
jgi:hypothetical protein